MPPAVAQPNDKLLQKLQKEWYAKLRESGFKDIEQADGNLKIWSRFFKGKLDTLQGEAKAQYFRAAGQFLHSHQFASEYDKTIWDMHANGISGRSIARQLRVNKNTVFELLEALKKEMLKSHGIDD